MVSILFPFWIQNTVLYWEEINWAETRMVLYLFFCVLKKHLLWVFSCHHLAAGSPDMLTWRLTHVQWCDFLIFWRCQPKNKVYRASRLMQLTWLHWRQREESAQGIWYQSWGMRATTPGRTQGCWWVRGCTIAAQKHKVSLAASKALWPTGWGRWFCPTTLLWWMSTWRAASSFEVLQHRKDMEMLEQWRITES